MQKRVVNLIVTGVALILILVGVLTRTWWGAEHGRRSVSIGLHSVEACEEGECESRTLAKALDGHNGAFVLFGNATFFAGLLLAAGLIGSGVLVLTSGNKLPFKPGFAIAPLAGLTLILAICFMASQPDDMGRGIDSGAGLPLTILGCIAGAIGAFLPSTGSYGGAQPVAMPGQMPLSMGGQPMAQPGQPMMPPGQAPMCPQCGTPAVFIPQYGRWFCQRDNSYL